MFKEGIPFIVWLSTNLMKIILLSPCEWDSPTIETFSSFFLSVTSTTASDRLVF
jgi:hypothetical protein